jgi:6,7-dimethyl-8-ribityllumazine synthase
MSDNPDAAPAFTQRTGAIAIVASRYNAVFVDALKGNAIAELKTIAPRAEVCVFEVPGAFEIPLMVAEVAQHRRPAAILALGVIIAGETEHADLIARATTHSLQQLSLEFRVPVIHEVLLVANAGQARERTSGSINRGAEAARAAVGMIEVLSQFRTT